MRYMSDYDKRYDKDNKKAVIKVDEEQKPVAIWKKASNIKLASQIMWITLEIV